MGNNAESESVIDRDPQTGIYAPKGLRERGFGAITFILEEYVTFTREVHTAGRSAGGCEPRPDLGKPLNKLASTVHKNSE